MTTPAADGAASTALVVTERDYPIDFAIAAWLHAKLQRSQSTRTRDAYAATLESFRRTVRMQGYDLDGPTRELATLAQAWAHTPRGEGRAVAAATVQLRLAVCSSFYRYAKRMGHLSCENPIERVERGPVQTHHAAEALDAEDVRARMAAIETTTPAGRRDKALLAVALGTGRRLSEVAGLHIGDLTYTRGGRGLAVTWRRTKGNKRMVDDLAASVAALLSAYVHADRRVADASAPVWVSYRGPAKTRGTQLGIRAIERICAKRLGVARFHATRHTFAVSMEDAGAKVSDIQKALGHSNPAVTGRYLATKRRTQNPHGDAVAAALGLA